MKFYYFTTLKESLFDLESITFTAMENYKCLGVEEYSIDEESVDKILAERSYSGGDIPQEVLDEVELKYTAGGAQIKLFFKTEQDIKDFCRYLFENFNVTLEIEKKEVEDWNESWKSSFSPIHVNDYLEIVPSWYESYSSKAQRQLKIYPGMGFGTGNHETTFLCLQLFFNCNFDKENLSVLDFGCGSGILGLAVKLFNQSAFIDLYDIDQEAIDNCVQNISINQMDENSFGLYLPVDKDKIQKNYDLIFANILKNILISESDFLSLNIKKDLILSGLLIGQEDEVIEHYQRLLPDLKIIKILKKGDWCAIHLQIF